MKKFKHYLFFASLFLVLFLVILVFVFNQNPMEAEEEVVEGFYLLEIVGSVISVIALVSLVRAAILIGGQLGLTFKAYSFAFLLITVSLIWRACMEFFRIEGFLAEVVFEVPIYIGLLFVLVGSLMAKKTVLGK